MRITGEALQKQKGPAFLRFVAPILATLTELGSSGNAGEAAAVLLLATLARDFQVDGPCPR
jgi:hypothetical protein